MQNGAQRGPFRRVALPRQSISPLIKLGILFTTLLCDINDTTRRRYLILNVFVSVVVVVIVRRFVKEDGIEDAAFYAFFLMVCEI